jgi:hypothetical protein
MLLFLGLKSANYIIEKTDITKKKEMRHPLELNHSFLISANPSAAGLHKYLIDKICFT